MKSRLTKIAGGLVFLGLFAVVSWAVTDYAFHATGGEEFCSGCHTMEPIAEAYGRDIHGGNNPQGIAAECVDCHLSHTNPLTYFYTKAKFGLNDIYSQYFTDLDAIDWQAMREHREDYVFDSGCLQCHQRLETAPKISTATYVAHRPYFLGETRKKCVSCHEHVGHEDLGSILQANQQQGDGK